MNDTRETFEDRLWDALKHEAGRPDDELPADRFRPGPARRPATARRVGMGLAAAAVAGTVLALLPGGSGAQPAYALEVQKDGKVKISVQNVSEKDAAAAMKSLQPGTRWVHITFQDGPHYPAFSYACGDGKWHTVAPGEVISIPVSHDPGQYLWHLPPGEVYLHLWTNHRLSGHTFSRLRDLTVALCFLPHK